jgi:polysaccharide export outer membrane protein
MTFKNYFLYAMICFCCLGIYSQEESEEVYRIGAKDLLEINVFGVNELNTKVRVSEDETITLPLLGKIDIKGMTRFELEKKLTELLEQKYLKNAQVTIFIKEYESKKVAIIGAIKNPGSYELIGRKTLLEMISVAGGLTDKASDKIIIIRNYEDGNNNSLEIDYEDLMIKGDARLNIPLQPGDVVNVSMERYLDIYVFGQVKNPGHLKVKKNDAITLLKVIAQAGGFAERARKTSVLVKRRVNGKETEKKINVKKILSGSIPDYVLENNDIVHVPESVL